MQAVNLLPEYARGGRRWTSVGSELNARRIVELGGSLAVIVAVAFALLYFHERATVSTKKSELVTAQAHLVAAQAQAKPIQDAQAANTARLAAMRSITATRVHWDSVLGDLGRDLPSAVFLSSLSMSAPTGAVVAGTTSFTIAGTTNSHNRVALVLDRLAVLPWLSGIQLQGSSRSGDTVSFTIGATYIPGAGT